MNFDEIQQAARAFGQAFSNPQAQGSAPGEPTPSFQMDSSYQQAQAMIKSQNQQAQAAAQQFQQYQHPQQPQQVQYQPQYAPAPQPVQYQQPQYAPAPQPPMVKAQAPVQYQQPVQPPVQQPPAPQQNVTQQPGYKPITNDLFQKALGVLDSEFIGADMRSTTVQAAIEQDASGFMQGITERLEHNLGQIVKAQNTRSAAQSTLLMKALEQVEHLSRQVQDLSRAPVYEPRGLRSVTAPPPQQAYPMQKSFPTQDGYLQAPVQQQQPFGQQQQQFGQQQPLFGVGGGGGPSPVNSLTKSQINAGLGMLLNKAGQAFEADKSMAKKAVLDRWGIEAGNFPITGEVSQGTKMEVFKALQESGMVQPTLH